jgi:tRNA threonylcarbamoyladenosine biosynthesis protein TsaB
MTVLAIETATRCAGCALWEDGGLLASFMLVAGHRHAEVLMPAVDELCRRAGRSAGDLQGVAVDIGPGLFTGLRVGLATASTIALARDLPAVGVTSLEALAHAARRRAGLVVAIVDARRSEVYWALFDSDGTRARQLRPPSVARPDDLARELAGLAKAPLAVGDGAWRYREVFEAAGAEVAGTGEMWPSPMAVAELGAERLARTETGPRSPGNPGLPKPLYLRQADVRIGWDQLGGRVGPGRAGTAGSAASETRLVP